MLFVLHPDFQLYFIEKNIKLIFNSISTFFIHDYSYL
jgi:hypothetical protein